MKGNKIETKSIIFNSNTIPEFERIVMVSYEELPNFLGNGQSLDLIRINR